jgi:hypothetical protein
MIPSAFKFSGSMQVYNIMFTLKDTHSGVGGKCRKGKCRKKLSGRKISKEKM